MKKLFLYLIFLVSFFNISSVYGNVIGKVLSTDIVVFIDSQPIPSYNIDDKTYVIAEDLSEYGFDVEWNESKQILYVKLKNEQWQKPFLDIDEINQLKNDIAIGTELYSVYDTDIQTFVGEKYVNACNIDGKTLIPVAELSAYGDILLDEDGQINVRVRLKTLRTQWEIAEQKQSVYLLDEDKNRQQYIGQMKDGKPNGIGKIITDRDDGMTIYHDEEYGTFVDGIREGDFYKSGNSYQYTGSNHLGNYISENYSTYKNGQIDGFSISIWRERIYHGYRIEGFFKGEIKNGLYRSSEYNQEYRYGHVIQEEGTYIDDKIQDF